MGLKLTKLSGSFPVNKPGARKVAKAREVQFRPANTPPDPEHVPNLDVIENQQSSRFQPDPLKVIEKLLFLNPVFGRIDKYQVGLLENGRMRGGDRGIRQIFHDLAKLSPLEIGGPQYRPGDLVPRCDIEGDQRTFGRKEGKYRETARPGVGPNFHGVPHAEHLAKRSENRIVLSGPLVKIFSHGAAAKAVGVFGQGLLATNPDGRLRDIKQTVVRLPGFIIRGQDGGQLPVPGIELVDSGLYGTKIEILAGNPAELITCSLAAPSTAKPMN